MFLFDIKINRTERGEYKHGDQNKWKKINDLAYEFSLTRNQTTFRDLFFEIYPFLHFWAVRSSAKALQWGIYIPQEDFESHFGQALYQSTIGYDLAIGDFMPRFQSYLKLREADVWRSYQTKCNDQDRGGIRYYKAQLDSLDRKIAFDDEGITLGEAVLPHSPSAEQEYFEKIEVQNLLAEFRKVNSRYANVVSLLDRGTSNNELAHALGEGNYNNKVRKLVQRSKAYFLNYIDEKNK
ncbi:hypothetical protein [Cohnella cholangitidis]|uniref:Uncharacterized protein n=1 Tax=Cohnella cholangitidis TaxID=2598458 RepID=A0A7G5BY10_9BACL|nr:hypothetical protein [Cohnella cholangitidis]QMV41844.1 hypothetical protein FPL14_12105 [Cohnella cholangitidis]